MGTSSNQRSPNTPSWRLARAVVGSEAAPAEQQSREIWRAATSDPDANLAAFLCSPRVFEAAKLAQLAASPSEAAERFTALALESGSATFLDATASRALIRTVANGGDVKVFAGELLSEVVSYYASRDLPSYVGTEGRIKTATASIDLKNQLREKVRAECAATQGKISNAASWATFVQNALTRLTAKKKA